MKKYTEEYFGPKTYSKEVLSLDEDGGKVQRRNLLDCIRHKLGLSPRYWRVRLWLHTPDCIYRIKRRVISRADEEQARREP